MRAPDELGYDLGLWAREWISERAQVAVSLAATAAARPEAGPVHEARVACRRLREAVSFFASAPELPDLAALDRAARRLARALGSLRESDVAAHLLPGLGAGPLDGKAGAACKRLTADVARARARQGRHRQARLDRRAARLRHEAARLRGTAEAPPDPAAAAEARTRHLVESRLAERRAAVSARARAVEDGPVDPAALHALRIAVKHFRYACEIGRAALPPEVHQPLAAGLRRLQQLGGRSQDLSDLVRRLERAWAHSSRRHAEGTARLLQLAAAAREEAALAFIDGVRSLLPALPMARATGTRTGTSPSPLPLAAG